ncbi:unnamed protein product [Agarophyton chilense]|eukprot:gb/GEZJ01003670.1/.p1 GENE.gb/GEZJ01003670.1/~~gb/GEZJ01003670.1/.p1  ORF type:complete len:651 (-),score=54.40 gb/GEZJ01003670.1/:411-2363(-)
MESSHRTSDNTSKRRLILPVLVVIAAYMTHKMLSQTNKATPKLAPIISACPTRPQNVLREIASAFACPRGFSLTDAIQPSQPALLCHRIDCRQALQSLLWSCRVMHAFSIALAGAGVILFTDRQIKQSLPAWFPAGAVHPVPYLAGSTPPDEVAFLLRARPNLVSNDVYKNLHTVLPDHISLRRYAAVLACLVKADFISSENEQLLDDHYYLAKVQAWSAAGYANVLERHTGIEYFARFNPDVCVLISVGLYSATDRPCDTLHDFVYERAPLRYTLGHDTLGVANTEGQNSLRSMLHDVVSLLGGPSMALIYAVSSGCVAGFRFAKIDLCRAEYSSGGELGDLSWISRPPKGYDIIPIADERVVGDAMMSLHCEGFDRDMEKMLEGDNVPVPILLRYDVRKAICAIPHRRAMNRLRYAALLSRRTIVVPDATNALYPRVEPTSIIHTVNVEGRIVRREWLVRSAIVFVAVCGAAGAGYGVSRDDRVNDAEVLGTVLAVLIGLVITVPQLYVECIGAGYSIGDFYRGCLPMTLIMERRGLAFLKECVRKGADVEGVISGRNGCFLLGRAKGNLGEGPVKVEDLDDRWDYGVNDKGVLCLRYRGLVGDMQIREREKKGKMCRWWHCAVIGSKIVKTVSPFEVRKLLGDGEIG